MPLAQIPNRSSTLAPHLLCDRRVTLWKALERVPRPQIVSGREGRINKVQVLAPDLPKKQATGLGISSQVLDVLPEHVEDLFVEVDQYTLIWC